MKKNRIDQLVRIIVFIGLVTNLLGNGWGGVISVNASSSANKQDLQYLGSNQAIASNGNFNDTDNAWTYVGKWMVVKSSGAFGGQTHDSRRVNESATLTITGTKFVLMYTTGITRGIVNVLVDGVKVGTINQHANSTAYKVKWASPVLSTGNHVVKFVHARGTTIDIDMVSISDSTIQPAVVATEGSVPTVASNPANDPAPVIPTSTNNPEPLIPTATDSPVPVNPTPTNNPEPAIPTATDSPVPVNPTPTNSPEPVIPASTDIPASALPSPTNSPEPTLIASSEGSPTPGNIKAFSRNDTNLTSSDVGSPTPFVSPTPSMNPRAGNPTLSSSFEGSTTPTIDPSSVAPAFTDTPGPTMVASPDGRRSPPMSPPPPTPTSTNSPVPVVIPSLTPTVDPRSTFTPIPPTSTPPSLYDYFVDGQNGSDSNPGTQSQPWKTIQMAANSAVSGKSILVLSGDYSTQRTNISRSGLSFQAQGTVTVKGFQISADHITIKGFTIIDIDDNAVGILVSSGGWCDIENNNFRFNTMGGLSLAGPPSNSSATHDCIVRNNIFYRNGQNGIAVRGQNHLIESNDISQTIQEDPCNISSAGQSWLDSDGIRFFGGGHIFRRNTIHDISFGPDGYTQGTTCSLANLSNLSNDYVKDSHIDCFQTFAGSEVPAHDILFEDNYCNEPYSSPSAGLAAKALQAEGGAYNLTFRDNIVVAILLGMITDGHNIKILNNTFVGVPGNSNSQGIHLNTTSNATVQNNIFAYQQNGVGSIYPDSSSKTTLIAGYDCVYRKGGNPWRPKDPGDVWGLNPLFVNEAAGNYRLLSGSPCIDKGLNLGPGLDFSGVSRPKGLGYDMGAYEYVP